MEFTRLQDSKKIEIAQYVKDYIDEHKYESMRIYVGCDSNNRGKFTTYVTTVVIHVNDAGCHVLFQREKVPRIDDLWTKLWNEVERSVQLALYLRENGINIHNIDLDFNDDVQYKSNKLVSAAQGYIKSFGIKARIKPDMLPATRAADNLTR